MVKNVFTNACLIVCAASILMLTGCAGTIPKAEFHQKIDPESQIASKDEATVNVEASSDVTVLESEMLRMAEKIKEKIDARKISNNRDGVIKEYEINLLLTRYDKGNAFARAMLAGLGQIHIDGDVTIFIMPERTQVGNFVISKTFAWGGLYGAGINIENIETTFADGVAAALTGQIEEQEQVD